MEITVVVNLRDFVISPSAVAYCKILKTTAVMFY